MITRNCYIFYNPVWVCMTDTKYPWGNRMFLIVLSETSLHFRYKWWKRIELGMCYTLYGASFSLAQVESSSKLRAGIIFSSRFLFTSASGTIIAHTISPYVLSIKPRTQHSETDGCCKIQILTQYHCSLHNILIDKNWKSIQQEQNMLKTRVHVSPRYVLSTVVCIGWTRTYI